MATGPTVVVRILYGVASEGMGHATRSQVVCEYLRAQDHEVLVATAGRAAEAFRSAGFPVIGIHALRIRFVDGAMDLEGTIAQNLATSPVALAANLAAWSHIDAFAPQAAITDFEPFSGLYAHASGLPIASIDNHQVVARCDHDSILQPEDVADAGLMEAFVRYTAPGCMHYVVTSFFAPAVRPGLEPLTTLVPPILRSAVLQAQPRDAGHVLVYRTAGSDSHLLEALHAFPRQRFVVYGLDLDAVNQNVLFKRFGEQGFVNDLASAHAVAGSCGSSLLGECVALGKPVYGVPMLGHFEQILNARYIAARGFGMLSPQFEASSLGVFLSGVPFFAARIAQKPRHDANRALYAAIDHVVDGFARSM